MTDDALRAGNWREELVLSGNKTMRFGRSAVPDNVRLSDDQSAFAESGLAGYQAAFCDYACRLFYSYRPNQIYRGSVFFRRFQARQ
jgi:hypothetical protein